MGFPHRRVARLLGGIKLLCLSLGVMALAYCGMVMVEAAAGQARAREVLKHLRAQFLAGSWSHSSWAPAPGSVVGSLENPRIGLSVMVLEGTDGNTLKLGAGHLTGSGLPGGGGNMVIAGHRDTFFRPLRNVRVGDVIDLISPEGTDHYEVVWRRVVAPDDIGALQPTRRGVLTLVTCYPFSYIGAAPERLVVRAKRVEAAAP
ncbi:MAG: class D sortase [Acidobacteriia bacterium]|nr:class D sortase [Terriglobia bacterium]